MDFFEDETLSYANRCCPNGSPLPAAQKIMSDYQAIKKTIKVCKQKGILHLTRQAGQNGDSHLFSNPDCRLDRFVVRHISVAARAGSPDGSIWALCKKIFHFQSCSTPIELPSGLARFAAPNRFVWQHLRSSRQIGVFITLPEFRLPDIILP